MTIEEKAKAYDEALERMKSWARGEHPECFTEAQKAAEFVFPELAESEDERIRKKLIELFHDTVSNDEIFSDYGLDKTGVLAWLEKQGEKLQGKSALEAIKEEKVDNANKIEPKDYSSIDPYFFKATDKAESRFKVGYWVVFNNKHQSIYQVEKIEDGYYILRHTHGGTFRVCVLHDESLRLWNISDVKGGDVLEFGDHGRLVVGIVSYVNKTTGKVDVNCLLENNNFKVGNYYNLDTIKPHPATKEQRELLFQKIKDAGYEWNEIKNELKEIEQKSVTMSLDEAIEHCKEKSCGNNACALEHKQLEKWLTELKELKEQKHAWSEKDDYNLQCMIAKVTSDIQNGNVGRNQELIDWLKLLKDRYTWKPSDEQIEALEHFVRSVGESGFVSPYDNNTKLLYSLLEQLKSFKDRVQLQPKQEWSKEDKNKLNRLIGVLDGTNKEDYHEGWEGIFLPWLKSLKSRILKNQ